MTLLVLLLKGGDICLIPAKVLKNSLRLSPSRGLIFLSKAADLKDAGPTQKAQIIASYKKEAKDLDQQLAQVRAALDQCVSRRDVIIEGFAQPGLDAFDLAVQRFMHRNNVRAGQLTILKDGFDILVHAYTFASASYPRTRPNNLFRIASCSKAFTCAAISQLFADKLVTSTTPVFEFLGITKPLMGFKIDSRVDQITVQHLVDHAGGWNDHDTVFTGTGIIPGTNWDPVFHVRDIAIDLGLAEPPTKTQIAEYMYGQKLQFSPGTQDYTSSQGKSYSNLGYVLLGLVIEKATSKSYIDYVRDDVLKPLGLEAHVFVSPMLNLVKNPLEVGYDDPGHGWNALQPLSFIMVPNAYGAEGFITELMDAGGGLMTTATNLALLVHNRAIWGLGPRVQAARTGSMAGTSSRAESRGGDVDYAFVFNTRYFTGTDDPLKVFTDELESLFNTVKLPTPKLQL